jgi:predicted GNAT family acetyltransferase
MNQTFKLEVNAESEDGSAIKCNTSVQIHCEKDMAVGIIASIINENENMKDIFMEAILLTLLNKKPIEKISDEDYDDTKDPEL